MTELQRAEWKLREAISKYVLSQHPYLYCGEPGIVADAILSHIEFELEDYAKAANYSESDFQEGYDEGYNHGFEDAIITDLRMRLRRR